MKHLILMMTVFSSMNGQLIFDFNKDSDIRSWMIVDDVVMGGRSSGSFHLSADGYGVFEGTVSLENNGGFSSVRHRFQKIQIKEYTRIVIRLKGDGKEYQFRIKSDSSDYYSYISKLSTNGAWQELEIPLKDMYPSFRGRRLDQPNFSEESIEEVAFLIANKKEEQFKLLLDRIELK